MLALFTLFPTPGKQYLIVQESVTTNVRSLSFTEMLLPLKFSCTLKPCLYVPLEVAKPTGIHGIWT